MKKLFITSLFLLLSTFPAYADILVYAPAGGYTTKPTLSAAATSADCAGKTVVVTSALSSAMSNISSATTHQWPADRTLKVVKGGSIGNTTIFRFASGANFEAGHHQTFAGTGRVTGLSSSKPKWFGANEDGTDDTDAIRKAISSTDGDVLFEPVTYGLNISTSITLEGGATLCSIIMKSNMHLKGIKGKTRLKILDNQSTDGSPKYANMFASNESLTNVTADGIIFDMNGANNKISPSRGSGTYNRYNWAAFIWSGPNGNVQIAAFTNNQFINSPGVTCIGLGQSNTPGTALSSQVEISHNRFFNNGIDSDDHSSVYAWGESILIDGNLFSMAAMPTNATGARVAAELHGARNTFVNNEVGNYYQGLFVAGNGTRSTDSVVISNNIFNVQSLGVVFFRESATENPVNNAIVTGNHITLTDTDSNNPHPTFKIGIDARPSYGMTGLIASDNMVVKVGGSTYPTIGIRFGVLDASSSFIDGTATNNTFRGLTFGGYVATSAGTVHGIKFNGNTTYNLAAATGYASPQGFYTEGTTMQTVEVKNNTFNDANNVAASDYGLYLTGTIQTLIAEGNNYIGINTPYLESTLTVTKRYGREARTFAALPTQSSWVQGDVVYNGSHGELGTAGSKYIVDSWYRVTTGTNNVLGTDWLQQRYLTGN